ncbi:transposase, partial [Lactobacillus delbrueckii]|uniref:transposase n=1 Tax=Lactobacillus delbrueckii TaxID=1584 RepID=UPI0022834D54
SIPFKADGYRITKPLKEYTEKLLSYGLTLKAVAWLTGLDKMTVKSIHKSLLLSKFTTNGKILIKPERQAKYLAIDEFKLHDGHKYATTIIDWENGYILYLAHGKKKAVVFEFMEAVACDMNSDFEEAFKERYPKLDIIYDRFHIIKNFNDKVVSEIRKDEQRRLAEEGSPETAKLLKNSRYILMSKRSTLVQKDEDARKGKLVSTAGEIFNTPEIKAHG